MLISRQDPLPIAAALSLLGHDIFGNQLLKLPTIDAVNRREVDIARTGPVDAQPAVELILQDIDPDQETPIRALVAGSRWATGPDRTGTCNAPRREDPPMTMRPTETK